MEIRKPNLSSAAVLLKQRLAKQGIRVSHCEALEHAAAMEGYQSYQAYQQHQKLLELCEKPMLVLENPSESGRDYRFVGNKGEGAWIRMRNISVYIKADDEGVAVDLFNSGAESEGSEASTYHLYQDAAQVQLERASELDYMKDHLRKLLAAEGITVFEDREKAGNWRWNQRNNVCAVVYDSEWDALADAAETVF